MNITIHNYISPKEHHDIFNHFQTNHYLQGLIALYQSSQMEGSRFSHLTPEIGSLREKDLIASFRTNPLLDVRYHISNKQNEDVIIQNRKISIKHSSKLKTGPSGIKVIWTAHPEKQQQFFNQFEFYSDLLIVYVRFSPLVDQGQLEIIYLPVGLLNHYRTQALLETQPILKPLRGNNRGIEFDPIFFSKIVSNSLFHIHIQFKNAPCQRYDPILRRVSFLQACYSLVEGSNGGLDEREKLDGS